MKKILVFLQPLFPKLQEYFFTTLHLLVAAFLLYGLFYIRLLPRTSRGLWQNLTYYQFFLILLTLTFIIFNIYNTFKLLGFIKEKERSTWTTIYLYPLEQLYEYVIAVLKNLYGVFWFVLEKLANKFFNISYLNYKLLIPLVRSFTNPKHSPYYFVFFLASKMVPRIIFVLALAYDVFFCKKFDYTFCCIPFLLIVLLEPFFIFVFKRFFDIHMPNLLSYIYMEPIPNSDDFNYLLNVKEEDLPHGVKDFLDFYYNHLSPVDQILLTLEKYETWKTEKIRTYYIQLILQIVRLIVYIYVLYYGIM